MNSLLEAAKEAGAFMTERVWAFCIIGGLAVQRWGEPRTTLDADMVLLARWGEEEPYVEALLARFASRIPDGRAFALSRRVLLLLASNGKNVDIALGALPFEEEMVRRAPPVNICARIDFALLYGRGPFCDESLCRTATGLARCRKHRDSSEIFRQRIHSRSSA